MFNHAQYLDGFNMIFSFMRQTLDRRTKHIGQKKKKNLKHLTNDGNDSCSNNSLSINYVVPILQYWSFLIYFWITTESLASTTTG